MTTKTLNIAISVGQPLYGYMPLDVFCMDGNRDGIIDAEDLALFEQAFGSSLGDPNYVRRFDAAHFDGVIGDDDRNLMEFSMGLDIDDIRSKMSTGIYVRLEWPDSGNEAYLNAVSRETIPYFMGGRVMGPGGYPELVTGWCTIENHPYTGHYVCGASAFDLTICAYKALGYGRLLYAVSKGTVTHMFNMFWSGEDWHDLRNWWGLDQQSGAVMNAASDNITARFAADWINFPLTTEGTDAFNCRWLSVDRVSKTVDYGERAKLASCTKCYETPPPIWDTTLGLGSA